jgi:pyruvate kinase
VRSTKIVATLGPASDSLVTELIRAGVDVFRLNFSHGSHQEHLARIRTIRRAARVCERSVAILADLQGPKVRIRGFKEGSINLTIGDSFSLDPSLGVDDGDQNRVGITYPNLAEDVDVGDRLVLGDGNPLLEVRSVSDGTIQCLVIIGGALSAGKGINLKGGGLSAAALADKDLEDLRFLGTQDIDYVALSFVQNAADIQHARMLMAMSDSRAGLIAKIERADAVSSDENVDELIMASDGIMVARGDLGIEIGDAALMGMQKRLIQRARELNRTVITATQMMETMVSNPYPTRAEVMDVANAVLDGTDAVMLSAETAVGRYPLETVQRMVSVIEGAEGSAQSLEMATSPYRCENIDESIAMATMTVAERLANIKAVVSLTASGKTPRLMSRSRSRLPIYALANNEATLGSMAIVRGVHPRLFRSQQIDYDRVNEAAIQFLQDLGTLSPGDRVVLSKGDYRDVQGGTNTMKILEVA